MHRARLMPIRAEQVGSLLRPPALLAARAAFADGRLDLSSLRAKEDEAIRAAVTRQREIGLDVLADGEMRRYSWLTGMADSVDGFMPDSVMLEWHGPGGGPEKTTARIVGATLRRRQMLTAHEVPLITSLATSLPGLPGPQGFPAPFKVTVPAPSNFVPTGFKPGVTDRFYKDRDALLTDLVAIVREEIAWLVDQGVTYIQLDAPFYSHYLDPQHRAAMKMSGADPDAEFSGRGRRRQRVVRRTRAGRRHHRRPHLPRQQPQPLVHPRAATTRSQSSCSRASRSIGSCSSTTRTDRAPSSRCVSFPAAKTSSSD